MKIPEIFFGKPGEVKSKVSKLVRDLLRTRDFAHFDPGPFLDTTKVGGEVLVTREHWPSTTPQFHCYLLPLVLQARAPVEQHSELTHEWLMASLDDEWRFMCTLDGDSHYGFGAAPTAGARRYAEAAVRHWPAMEREQYRFGPKINDSDGILDIWITLFAALDTLGLPVMERIAAKDQGPRALLDLADAANGRGGLK
jgi:hypothetical protein